MEYIIRQEQEKDYEQVKAILQMTFPSEAESNLVDALRSNGKAIISLVAVCAEEVIGHIMFSPVSTTPPSEVKGIGLAPVAVHPDMQSQWIGSKLIYVGLQLCRELEYDFCVVLGDPNYYERFGFETASRFGLENEYGVDEEFMITRFSDRDVFGLVKYSPEFAVFSV